jgi:hypothetical protein
MKDHQIDKPDSTQSMNLILITTKKITDLRHNPIWIKKNFSESIYQIKVLTNRISVSFTSTLKIDSKIRLKKNIYLLVCFIGFTGYAIISILVFAAWLFLDFIIAIFKFQRKTFYRANDNSLANEGTNFAIGLIVTILLQTKALVGYIIRAVGWGDFDYSNNGILKTFKNIFKEVRPSQTTFRFGILSLIIVNYHIVNNFSNHILRNLKLNRPYTVQHVNYPQRSHFDSTSNNDKLNETTSYHLKTISAPKTASPTGIDPLASAQPVAMITGEPGAKNIRSGPGTTYLPKRVAYPGERVKILASAKDSGGYLWYKVYFSKPNDNGWIAAHLLTFN